MKKLYIILTMLVVIITSCQTNFVNPNAATEDDILNSPEGLIGLAVGIQQRFINGGSSPLYTNITASGLSSGELTVLNAGNAEIAQLESGYENVTPANGVIIGMWTGLALTISDCQDLTNNVDKIGDSGIAAGVEAYGYLFKALALGTMAQYWEQGVINTVKFGSGQSATFSSRAEVLNEAINLLANASSLSGTISAEFYAEVGDNIDIANASRALSARYKMMAGDYSGALSDANAVDLSIKSQFLFDNVVQNPVYRTSLITQNVYEAKPDGQLGLPASIAIDIANDERHSFYFVNNVGTYHASGFFTADEDPIPLYLPGEMMLIMAEAEARLNNLVNAVSHLDNVLTKIPAADAYGVGANLPAYSGAMNQSSILEEIYRNRAIELHMSGLRLEDSRRFNRAAPNDANPERTRNFYPYAQTEIDNNSNTPANPSI